MNSSYSFGSRTANRLCESTRAFAYESMHGRYGDEAMKTPFVSLDHMEGFDDLPDIEKYNLAIEQIARNAPLRICPGERVSGAATLGAAIWHLVPAYCHGEAVCSSVSHVTLGFDKALRMGINGLEREVDECMALPGDNAFRQSLKSVLRSFRIWHHRYLEATTGTVHENLTRVPLDPPRNFYEAVQGLWFLFAFTRLCGNWPGIGRIDQMLGGYLKKDLQDGVLTLDEAREILAHFFIKGCEWILKDTPVGSGDAQHYQNIILAGVDEKGYEVANEVTYLVLDIIEELGISDFPVTIRVNAQTDEKLLARAAEVVKLGGGVIAFYNEELILKSLTDFHYPLETARRFANDGCWEVQIPGETFFGYIPFDALRILLDETLQIGASAPPEFESYDALYEAFLKDMGACVTGIMERYHNSLIEGRNPDGSWRFKKGLPCSVVSLLTEGCAKQGKSYCEGGAIYTVLSPHIGGAADAANSLFAIRKLVYEEKRITLEELCAILADNWEGNEPLRQYVRNHYVYYGNDSDESDQVMVCLLNDFADMVFSRRPDSPILYIPGVSTFGRQIEWASMRKAVPFGYRQGDLLSGNTSPTPGTDLSGATSVIRSYCKADLSRQVCGAALDIILHSSAVSGENGTAAFVGLIQGFCDLGGYFMQIDALDAALLRRAQQSPQDYKTLSVRVSGWNARFVTLNREWQNMIIERTESGF